MTERLPRRLAGLAAVACLGLALAACDKDEAVEPPAELVDFDAKIAVQRAWTATLGGSDPVLRLALRPVVDADRLYAAGGGGDVAAFDPASGRTLWRARTKLPLSAGPGAGGDVVAVGTSDGRLVALDAATGEQLWQATIGGEVLATPAVTPEAVIVRTVNGLVRAYAPADGTPKWTDDEAVPRLTLRGTSSPVVAGDAAIVGFDNGKVVAYAVGNGDVLWESAVSPARGRTELERLVDIDGTVAVSGRDVFVAGFQGRAAMLALDSGQVWWARDLSSYRGLAVGGETVYVTAADSTIQALRRRDGTPVWSSDRLARRGLSGPAVDGEAVVVADFEGWVHWLDGATGDLLGRIDALDDRTSTAPLAADGLVYVQDDGGRLVALRASPRG